jgi:hypothetical protein
MLPNAIDEVGLEVLIDFETDHIVVRSYHEGNRISRIPLND